MSKLCLQYPQTSCRGPEHTSARCYPTSHTLQVTTLVPSLRKKVLPIVKLCQIPYRNDLSTHLTLSPPFLHRARSPCTISTASPRYFNSSLLARCQTTPVGRSPFPFAPSTNSSSKPRPVPYQTKSPFTMRTAQIPTIYPMNPSDFGLSASQPG